MRTFVIDVTIKIEAETPEEAAQAYYETVHQYCKYNTHASEDVSKGYYGDGDFNAYKIEVMTEGDMVEPGSGEDDAMAYEVIVVNEQNIEATAEYRGFVIPNTHG